MRCFVAVPFLETVKQQLGVLQEPVKGLRWQKINQLHITLKFLGDVSEDKVKALQTEFSKIKMPAFSLSLQGLGYFPKGKRPRVLWAGVEENQSLRKLRDKVEGICVSAGFKAGARPFMPHITLARVKGASGDEVESLITRNQQLKIHDIPVDEFVLYESKLHSMGAEHIRLKSFGLGE
ncbi:MAG TPA: RNA 2',3'-cyclic phosphodiesterase [Balneolaceae bacterium]